SRSIYGLNFARQRMIESGTAVIVEGYTDVVMAHQYGVTNAVSILGTALTEQHVNLLKRFAKKVVLLFDPDVAGDLAVDRALQFFVTNQIEIGVATLPDGVDPDEYLIAHGAAGFEQVVSNAVDVMSFKWKRLEERRRSADGVTDLESAVQEYMAPFDQARAFGGLDPIRWGFLLTRISRLTGLGVDELNRRFSIRKTLNKVAKPAEAAEQAPATPVAPTPAIKIPMAQELAERQMLGILLNEPNRWHKIGQFVHPEDFADPGRRKLAEIYWQHQQDVGEPVFREFVGELTDPVIKELAIELIGLVEETQEVEETLRGALGFLQEEKRRREEQKQLADLRRISQQSAGPEAEAKWAEFVKNNQTLDLRRLGPIRRFKSGS
ncbi:MAG TPA: toprim domain-containing protein, partial [Tepidisphaeraceae bacterium]